MRPEPPLGRVAARVSFPRLQSIIRWTTVFYSPSWKNPSVLLVQVSPGLDTIIPGWKFSNLPDRARQIQRHDRVFQSASGYNPRSTVLHRLYSRDRDHHRETTVSRCISTPTTPSCTITHGSTTLSGRWQPWRPVCRTSSSGAVSVDSNSTLPKPNSSGWIERTQSESSNNNR